VFRNKTHPIQQGKTMLPNKIFSLAKLSEELFHGEVSKSLKINERKIVPRTHKDGSYRFLYENSVKNSPTGLLGTIQLIDLNNNKDVVAQANIYQKEKRHFEIEFWNIGDNSFYVNEALKNSLKSNVNLEETENKYYSLCSKFNVSPTFNDIYSEHISQERYMNALISDAKNYGYHDLVKNEIIPILHKSYNDEKDFKNDMAQVLSKVDHSLDEILKIDEGNMSAFQYVCSNLFSYMVNNQKTNMTQAIYSKINSITSKGPASYMTKYGSSFESESDWED